MTKNNKQTIKKLIEALRPVDQRAQESFATFDRELLNLSKKVKQDFAARTLDDVNIKLDEFKRKIDLKPVLSSLEEAKTNSQRSYDDLSSSLKEKERGFMDNIHSLGNSDKELLSFLKEHGIKISDLSNRLDSVKNKTWLQDNVIGEVKSKIESYRSELKADQQSLLTTIDQIRNNIEALIASSDKTSSISSLGKDLEEVRRDFFRRLESLGGGSQNRQILVGGSDILTRYTDINLIAGTNVTISSSVNTSKKRVDITISGVAGAGLAKETPVGAVDDSNVTFTVTNEPIYIVVNGSQYVVGTGTYVSYVAGTITLSSSVGTGGFIRSFYNA